MKKTRILFCMLSLSIISWVYPRAMKPRNSPIANAPMPNQPAVIAPQQPLQNPNINARTPQQPAVIAPQQQLQKQNIKVNYGMATAQNKRDYQEDRFAYAKINNGDFFGVYDGHGGDKTSSFLGTNFHKYFITCLENKTLADKKTFECAYENAENHVLKNFEDGATSVTAYINNNTLQCAWTGDSRLVLEKNGSVDFVTQDHKPDNQNELDRIKKAGGTIVNQGVWRVNGLAISRSIGDRPLKEMGKGQIIAIPEYTQVQLSSDNHFLIIASDGLWDVIDSQEAIDTVKTKLSTRSNLNAIARDLQNEAIARGSQDNITVCVVTFGELTPATPLRNASPRRRQAPAKKPARARNPKRTPYRNRAQK